MLKKTIILFVVLLGAVAFAEDKVEARCNKRLASLKRKYKKAQIKQFKSTIAKYKALQKKTLQAKDLEGAIKIKKVIDGFKRQLKNGDFTVTKAKVAPKSHRVRESRSERHSESVGKGKSGELESDIAKYKALKEAAVKDKDIAKVIRFKRMIANLESKLKRTKVNGASPTTANVTQTGFDAWSVRCYTNDKWKVFPLSKMDTESSNGTLKVTNTTGIHTVAKLAAPFDVGVDFTLFFKFSGCVSSFEFLSKNGNDAVMFIKPGTSLQGDSTLKVTRTGGDVEAEINGKVMAWESWYGSFDNSDFCICVVAGEKFTISDVVYKTVGQFDEAIEFNGHYYRYIPGTHTWTQAKALCEEAGGYLACVGDGDENEFVASLTKGQVAWLGGTDKGTEGKWRWINGAKFSYTNWDLKRKEPNGGRLENYLAIGGPRTSSKSHWNDATSKGSKVWGIDGFVCEWDEKPE